MNQASLFQHTNAALAATLATCGVPFWEDEHGQPRPVLNIYDAQILRRYKDARGNPVYQGWKLEEAARHAWQNGRKGQLVYNFQCTKDCERVLEAFDAHSQAITGADKSGLALELPLDVSPEVAAKICCQFVKNRNVFTEGWRVFTPLISVQGPDRTETDEQGREVRVGSFRVVSLTASADLREKVGL